MVSEKAKYTLDKVIWFGEACAAVKAAEIDLTRCRTRDAGDLYHEALDAKRAAFDKVSEALK